ncbi:hypothetical protein QBC44DRAFT_55929 [Cladorrhinum sp. PSN332]|nr:hypothetical protein QBC44DRAFT_55929 [Cladorrhinum sp. PSN332]
MCGITVSIAPMRGDSTTTYPKEARASLEASLSQSLDKIAHRGPDAQGIWINSDNTVALAHNRLAINDLSASGTQPIHSPDGTIHAVVNGEIYDFDRIRLELTRDHDYKFKSTSDSELIVALYQTHGAPQFLSHLRGEFAFVLYDETKNTVIAARDRFGIKPLFWTSTGGRVLLASEAKAFLPLGWEPEWNVGALVAGDWATGEKTVFKDVKKIKPACWMEIKPDGEIVQRQYWDLDYKDKREPETRSVQEMILGVRDKLTEAVRLRLRADVPIGIYLSGGIDSSLLAGVVTKLVREEGIKIGNEDAASSRICCFTIQFPRESGFDESDVAERTANWLGVKVIKKEMDEATLAENFADAAYHTEHHQIDLNFVGKFVLSTAPRENGFKVVLTGEGSDEHFAGYPVFVGDHLREPDLAMANDELAESAEIRQALQAKNNMQLEMLTALAGIFSRPWEGCEAFDKVNGVRTLGWAQNLQPVIHIFAPWVRQTWNGVDGRLEVTKQMSPEALDKINNKWHPLHSSQYLWSKTVLSDTILTCLGDRGEMAHSVEARPPFLDHELSEYVNALPPSVKLAYTPGANKDRSTGLPWDNHKPVSDLFTEKWILREAGKPFITRELYERKKHPYVAPYLWPKDGPLHAKFKQICTKEAVENLGFVDWNVVEAALAKAFEPGEDGGWFRALLLTGAWISLAERFGIKKASR